MKVLILYASVTGNAKGMARILDQFFKHLGLESTVGQMQQTDPSVIASFDAVVFSTYTFTGGTIPPESEDFYADLTQLDWHDKQIVFGVAGTGDPFYDKDYNIAPDIWEKALEENGAIKGAKAIKIEQNATEKDMPAFAEFAKGIVSKLKEVRG